MLRTIMAVISEAGGTEEEGGGGSGGVVTDFRSIPFLLVIFDSRPHNSVL